MFELDQIRRDAPTRRRFMKLMGAAGIGAAAMRLVETPEAYAADVASRYAGGASADAAATVSPDAKTNHFPGIPGRNVNEQALNFALTLELLEADLYRQALNAASGHSNSAPLSTAPTGYRLKVPAGSIGAGASADAFDYLRIFAYVEATHRDFLITTIKSMGGTPVKANPRGYKLPPGIKPNLSSILGAILPLEETGVRAYLGAIPFVTNNTIAQAAAEIFSTEARHSAVINTVLGNDAGPHKMAGDQSVVPKPPADNALEYFLAPSVVLERASAFFK